MQGASGTGIGNFQEVGPLDTNLKSRNSTWLKKADLLFVVNSLEKPYLFKSCIVCKFYSIKFWVINDIYYSWFIIIGLKKDNPVGTGYSYVEDKNMVVKSDEEAGDDLTTLLKEIFNKNEKLQKSPLYVVAESYGGKFAVTLGLSAHKAIIAGQLKLKLGG